MLDAKDALELSRCFARRRKAAKGAQAATASRKSACAARFPQFNDALGGARVRAFYEWTLETGIVRAARQGCRSWRYCGSVYYSSYWEILRDFESRFGLLKDSTGTLFDEDWMHDVSMRQTAAWMRSILKALGYAVCTEGDDEAMVFVVSWGKSPRRKEKRHA